MCRSQGAAIVTLDDGLVNAGSRAGRQPGPYEVCVSCPPFRGISAKLRVPRARMPLILVAAGDRSGRKAMTGIGLMPAPCAFATGSACTAA